VDEVQSVNDFKLCDSLQGARKLLQVSLSPKSIFGFPLQFWRNRKKLTSFVAPMIILSHSFRLVPEAHFIPKGQHAGLASAYY
jgi:hypothetical protein